MPILRAGPWGNLTDSFQPVPGATNTLLDHYPVNCAKANWPNQAWAAYYELTEAGCCTPAQIEVTFPYTNDFGFTIDYLTVTIDRGSHPSYECYYSYIENPSGYSFPYYRGKVFEAWWNGSAWSVYFGDEYIAQAESTLLNSTDECDPVETHTISGTYYYNGATITITDPNA